MTSFERLEANKSIAQTLFRKHYGGSRNMMTPEVCDYGINGGYAWELSYGTGFSGEELWGVTVINAMLGTKEPELSNAFGSEAEARTHIAQKLIAREACPVDPQLALNCEACQ